MMFKDSPKGQTQYNAFDEALGKQHELEANLRARNMMGGNNDHS